MIFAPTHCKTPAEYPVQFVQCKKNRPEKSRAVGV